MAKKGVGAEVNAFGTLLRTLRDVKGMTQKELAASVSLGQPQISNLESGKSSPALTAANELARALEVDIRLLARVAENIEGVLNYAGSTDIVQEEADVERRPAGAPSVELLRNRLINEGNALAAEQKWTEALARHIPAFHLLPDLSARARFLADPLAVTYSNLCSFPLSDQLLDRAEKLSQLANGDNDNPQFELILSRRRGFNAVQWGAFDLGRQHYLDVIEKARELGNYDAEASGHHFLGRLLVERQMAQLFTEPPLSQRPRLHMGTAVETLERASRLDKQINNEGAAYYDALWKAKALTLEKDRAGLENARRISQTLRQGKAATQRGYALLEGAKIQLLEAAYERDLKDTKQQIRSILLDPLANTQHPYVVAEAFTLLAYCDLLLGKFSSGRSVRREGAAACHLVERIYPYEAHPLYQISRAMKGYFAEAMGPREHREYRMELQPEIDERRGWIFGWLRNFHLPEAP